MLDRAQRRLAAIVAADVAGFSRLIGADEEGTLESLRTHRSELIEPLLEKHAGRIANTAGDSFLLEFPSAIEAVRFSVALQKSIAARNADVSAERRIEYRIGINVGDVVAEGNDLLGDGVNVAARLEGLAEPGGICISRAVRDYIRDKLDLALNDMGEVEVKNIARPVRTFRILTGTGVAGAARKKTSASRRLLPIVTVAIAAIVMVSGVFWWQSGNREVVRPQMPPTDLPAIAVLPFDNMSGDPDQDYFSDGITDDLITDLSRISGLFVIARNSVFTYKGTPVKVQQVGRELGVTHVLEGSVRKAGDRVRINAQLVEASTGHHLWAETYDRKLRDVFAVQDDVKREIVRALAVELSVIEQSSLARRPTENVEAYEYYIRARRVMFEGDMRSIRLAYYAFEKAIEIDPEFAEAYAGLAMAYALDYVGATSWIQWTRSPERARANAKILAEKALQMKAGLALAEMALARLRLGELRFDTALGHAVNAVAFEPGNSEAHAIKARALTAVGSHEEALVEIEEAFKRNPRAPIDHFETLGMVRFALRDYAGAAESLQVAMDNYKVAPNWQTSAFLASAHGYMGIKTNNERWERSVSELSFFPAYRNSDDQEHLINGIIRSGLPLYASGFDPEKYAAKRVTGGELAEMFSDGSFAAYCQSVRLDSTLSFTADGTATWQLRHDINDTARVRIDNEQICMAFPVITRGREACFMAFRDLPGERRQNGYDFLIVGPELCYLSPKP